MASDAASPDRTVGQPKLELLSAAAFGCCRHRRVSGEPGPTQALRRALVRGQVYLELRLRAAVARLLDTRPSEPLEPLPGLPPTREHLQ